MENSHYHINNHETVSSAETLTSTILRESRPLEFHRFIPGYKETPLVSLKNLANKYNVQNIYVKDESFRFGLNAFKSLGASFAIHRILENSPETETFCTATDGNHGRAVAWASSLFKKTARVFVPDGTTSSRIEAIRKEGAIVEVVKGNYEETTQHAMQMSEKHGWKLVQDASWENYEEIPAYIKAGYFTQFQELEESLHCLPKAKVDVVFLQSGVGSWPSAAAWYYRNRYGKDRPKIIIVEPKEAAGFLASLKKGERCSPGGNYKTMMAGLNCGIPSLSAWNILKENVDAAIAIEDTFAEKAMREFYFPEGDDVKVISGESGAGGLAGFLAIMTNPRFLELKQYLNIDASSNILLYNTEGDTDPENFKRIIHNGSTR